MTKLTFSRREKIIFCVAACIFLLMPVMFMPDVSSQQNYFQVPFFRKIFLEYVLLLVFFILNFNYFTPNFYFRKKYVLYFLILAISFVIIYFIPEQFFPFQRPSRVGDVVTLRPRRQPPLFMKWSPKVLMFACITMVSLFLRHNKRYQEIKEEKQLSEIAYLRAQINPHFLFNTLNNIYALTLQKSDYASDAVMKLSKMMRFVVSESSKEFVPLQQDIEYIKNYIQLQQMRLVNKDSIDFVVDGNASTLQISPLLLINFIENAFKYGVLDQEDTPIKVYLTIEGKELELYVENEIETHQFDPNEKSEVGMKNTRKRLEYIYDKRHELNVNQVDNQYIVNLKLTLDD